MAIYSEVLHRMPMHEALSSLFTLAALLPPDTPITKDIFLFFVRVYKLSSLIEKRECSITPTRLKSPRDMFRLLWAISLVQSSLHEDEAKCNSWENFAK
jgi:hypothetical protein